MYETLTANIHWNWIFDWSLKYRKWYHNQDVFSISSIYAESLGDSTINDQEIISEISALFLLQLSDSLVLG